MIYFNSYSTDRSFVVRGSKIGVFKNTPSKLKYVTSINRIKDKEGKVFSPKKVHFDLLFTLADYVTSTRSKLINASSR